MPKASRERKKLQINRARAREAPMASSLTGPDFPAGETVAGEMARILEMTARLHTLLMPAIAGNPMVGAILEELQVTISRASALLGQKGCGADRDEVSSKKRKIAGGGGDQRGGSRRRTHSSDSVTIVKSKTLVDGQTWRKYGQKQIQNSEHPRSYFRCTHKYDQRCMAQRQVQVAEDEPGTFVITYFGEHSCRDTAAVIPAAVFRDAAPASAGSRLISFGVSSGHGARLIAEPAAASFVPRKQESGEEEAMSNLTSAASSEKMAVATPCSAGGGDVTSDFQGGGDLYFDFPDLEFDEEPFFS